MIKKYRKVETVTAEQFDGSDEMISHYFIEKTTVLETGYFEYHILTSEGWLRLIVGDWILTDTDGSTKKVVDFVFKKIYMEVK